MRNFLKGYVQKLFNQFGKDLKGMKESTTKYEDIERYELEALKEIKEKLFEQNNERERHTFLVRGIASGIIYGVFGILFVQFLFPVAEEVLLGDNSFASVGNLIVCSISLVLIALVTLYLRRTTTQAKNKLSISKKSMDVIEYEIKRIQYALEKRSCETSSDTT